MKIISKRAAELSENDLDQLMRIKYRIGQLYLEMQEHSEAQEIFNSQGQNRTQEFIIGLAEANLEVAQVLFSDWPVKIHHFIGRFRITHWIGCQNCLINILKKFFNFAWRHFKWDSTTNHQ